MNCPNCGNINNEGMNFCTNCGQKLTTSSQTINSQNTNSPIQPNVMQAQSFNNGEVINSSPTNNQVNNNIQNNNYNSAPINTPNNHEKKKVNKKLIFIIIGIVLLVGIGIYIFLNLNNNSNNSSTDLNSIFDPDKPIVIRNNGKYGYITSEGKMMIEPKYNSATEFYGDYAVVKADNSNEDSYYTYIYQVIDKNGNVKISDEGYFPPEYYSNYEVWVIDDALYNSKLNRITSENIEVEYIDYGYFEFSNKNNNTSGIMDYKGKVYYTWEGSYIYADISENENNKDDLYVRVTISDERDKIVSLKTGKVVYNVEDPASNHLYVQDDNIFREYNSDYKVEKWLYFIDGELAFETSEYLYDLEVYNYKNKILEVDYGYSYETYGKNQRRYYYDIKNKKMLEDKPNISTSIYDDIDLDSTEAKYGYSEFSSSGKYGLMKNDKIVIPCEYDDIYFTNVSLHNYMKTKGKELVYLEKDDVTKLMNLKNQKVLTTFNSTYIYSYDNSTFLRVNLYENDNGLITGYLFYNVLSGKSITVDKSSYYKVYSNYITVETNDVTTYYNTNMKKIYTTE